jgi:hypothetical protein
LYLDKAYIILANSYKNQSVKSDKVEVVAEEDELGFFAHGLTLGATGGECPPGNAGVVMGLLDPRRVLIWSDTVFWPRSVSCLPASANPRRP